METDVMSFSGMFSKTSTTGSAGGGQQKVVCTPEVSLYQYQGKMGKEAGITIMENEDEKVGGFVCNLCGKTFHQKNTFQNHLRSHREGDDPYQCDICHKTFAVPARLTRHYRTHTGEKPYQCEYCNKSFSVKENLSVHRRIHTKERPYKCDVCERAFEHSGKLHRHMRIHTGERPHRCNICQKTFIQSGQLVIHMRTHTGEKPYVCKVCNKGFTCSKQLKVHTRTHTGEKPYTCDICGKSFGYNHVLKLHQVAHYGEKVYKCTLCNGTFNSKKALESHIKTHSSDAANTGTVTPPPSEPTDSLSPQSSVYQTPQHSDKENRGDASDSEISSQSSPIVGESPKSPSSPVVEYVKSIPEAIQHVKMMSEAGRGEGSSKLVNGLPYPMLPPTVQVHQAPQSRTTFLYVTSKLPPHGYNGTQAKTASNGPYSQPSQPRVITTNSLNLKTLQMGLTSPPVKETVDFNQNASIREKVLASIEKFGYGLSTNGISISPATRNDGPQLEYQRENGHRAVREAENLSKFARSEVEVSTMRNRSRSPDRSSYPGSFGHGGVLALALTRGSKAVVNSMQHSQLSFPHLPSVTIRPRTISESTHPVRYDSPPHSDRSSPEIISEMHRRSVSPPEGINLAYHRPTPSSTPGSSGGYSETNEDFSSDDFPHQPHSPLAGEKRHSSSISHPFKRSRVILEKYAQEHSPPPAAASSPQPVSPPVIPKESILSQRLRMSSVIQYAEKCT